MKEKRIRLSGFYLVFVLVLMYLPVLMVIIYSFNAGKSDVQWTGFTWDWYTKMFHNQSLMDALRNSLVLAVSNCAVSAVIGTLGAVGMAQADFKAKGLLENAVMLPIMIPEIILGMVFLAFFSFLGVPFGMITLILAHTAFCIPYIFIVVKGRLAGIDRSIGEAARDLGASRMRMFFDITLPLIAPAVLSGTLLALAMSMDDVVISIFVTGATTNTLPVKIYSQIKLGVTPEINALCTVMLLVSFILILISGWMGSGRKAARTEEKPADR